MKRLFDVALAIVTGLVTANAVASTTGFGPTNICVLSCTADVIQSDAPNSCPAGKSATEILVTNEKVKCDFPGTTSCTYCIMKVTEINDVGSNPTTFSVIWMDAPSSGQTGTIDCGGFKRVGPNEPIDFQTVVSCYTIGRIYRVRLWIWDTSCSMVNYSTDPPKVKAGVHAEWLARNP